MVRAAISMCVMTTPPVYQPPFLQPFPSPNTVPNPPFAPYIGDLLSPYRPLTTCQNTQNRASAQADGVGDARD